MTKIVAGRALRYGLLAALSLTAVAGKPASAEGDSLTIHRLEADVIDGAVLHTHQFLEGYNPEVRTMNRYVTARLKYAFMPPPDSETARIYKGSYQGVGLAYHHLNPQIGNPLSVYLFQGATIATLSPKLSLDYEWDFGLACGWKSYNLQDRPDNRVIGSRVTAYMDAGVYLRWRLSQQLDLNIGATASHFSNGNTSVPNAGLNVLGARLSLAYYLNRPAETETDNRPLPPFKRRWTTDVVVFGAWKQRGIDTDDGGHQLPGTYGVVGVNVNPLYNLNHWLNVGASLDMAYDHSANLSYLTLATEAPDGSSTTEDVVFTPTFSHQVGIGVSARGEFVMPYFTINFGIGRNIVNAGSSSFKGFYEVLALKTALSRRLFLHIGYSLYDFNHPNNLMLGMGYRFGNARRH